MNQIVCALYALGFVQLVISQGCSDAQSALTANATCTTAFTSRDVSVFCVGSCRTLFDNAINNCDNPTVASYSDVIDIFCTPCGIAQDALTSNNCTGVTDSDIICVGTCRTLFDNAINGCDNATGSSYSGLIDTICSPCSVAIGALSSSNTSCIGVTDPDILCMGTCRTLYDIVISSCDNETASPFSGLIDGVCSPCRMARVALSSSNISCFDTTDPDILCMGTCRSLYDTVISSCDNEIASTVSTALNSLCDGSDTETACQIAGEAVDDSCTLLLLATNSSVCSGICGFQVSIAATACASSSDSEIQGYISAYNTTCFSGPVCTAALQAFSADRECISAFFNNDTATYCSGTCGALIETAFDSCPNVAYYSRGEYNQDCGITGSGNVLQGSVIITLLLVAVCILIM